MQPLPWTVLALTWEPPNANGFRFMRGIAMGGDCPPGQLCCFSGAGGHSDGGGYFPPEDLITDRWREHIEKADALWLLPLLRRFAAGEPFDFELIADQFRIAHGRELTTDYFDVRAWSTSTISKPPERYDAPPGTEGTGEAEPGSSTGLRAATRDQRPTTINDTRRAAFTRWAAATAALGSVVFVAMFVRSWQNSVQTRAGSGEVIRSWLAVFLVPVIVSVAIGLIRAIRPSLLVRVALMIVFGGAAIRGLLLPFDTGDGICPNHLTTLTGTVRGGCFDEPKIVAAILWGMAVAAVILAIPERCSSSARRSMSTP